MKQIVTSEFWRNTKAESSQQENCYLKILKKTNYQLLHCWKLSWRFFGKRVWWESIRFVQLHHFHNPHNIFHHNFTHLIANNKNPNYFQPLLGVGEFISTFQNSLNPILFCTLSGFHWKMKAFISYSENVNYISHVKFATDFWMKQQGAYAYILLHSQQVIMCEFFVLSS